MIASDFQLRLSQRAAASGIDVPTALGEQLEAYYRLLAHWNTTINLTALPLDPITDDALDRLLIEPLTATPHLSVEASWFDFGSGGGSPAIPLKLARPETMLTMVESKYRKAAFLREAARSLGLTKTHVEAERIEGVATKPANASTADLITVRAVRVDSALLTAIDSLLKPYGRAIFFGMKESQLPALHGFEFYKVAAETRFIVLHRVI